ncbi:MAG TPA: hypothetical protein VIY47_12090, partial [Ignavibacteriaceae bacterium]
MITFLQEIQWSSLNHQTTAYHLKYPSSDARSFLRYVEQAGWKYITKSGSVPFLISVSLDLLNHLEEEDLQEFNKNSIVLHVGRECVSKALDLGFSVAISLDSPFDEMVKKVQYVILDFDKIQSSDSIWIQKLAFLPIKVFVSNVNSLTIANECEWIQKSAWCGRIQSLLPPLKDMAPQQKEIMDVMSICAAATHLQHVEQVIKSSVFLTGQLFKYMGSAASPYAHMKIQNVRQAVHALGVGNLYKWLSSLWVSFSSGYPFLQEKALVSARYLELKSKILGMPLLDQDTLFLCGLFSILEILTGKSPEEIKKTFHIPDDVVSILNGLPHPLLESAL